MADYVETVANALIKQLQAGTAPWIKPWRPGERFLPYNTASGKNYHGMNVVWLLSVAAERGYTDPRWLTYRQAQDQGAQVRRGEKGTTIQYWKWQGLEPVLDAAGRPVIGADGQPKKAMVQYERPRVWSAVVFNAAQIDGLAPAAPRPHAPDWVRHEQAERLLAAGDPAIRYSGDRAAYSMTTDQIMLPARTQFATADAFYATALHEKSHWTGHPSRLNRDLAHPFGSDGYAREELRAEIASLMLGEQLGIGHDPGQHAAYIDSWIALLQDDPKEIFRAAAAAEKIVTYVHGLAPQQQPDATPAPNPAVWTPDPLIQPARQQAPAFFIMGGDTQPRDAQTGERLPADWCGIAQNNEITTGRFWYIGQENGERSFTPLAAKTLAEATLEATLVQALAVDMGETLNNPNDSFTHYRSYRGATLDGALRDRGLTTVGSVTGHDPARFYEQAHNRLSPIFGIAYDHEDMGGPCLERKGLAQAFEATARQIHQALQQQRAIRAPAMPGDGPALADTAQIKMPVLVTEPEAAAMHRREEPVILAVPYAEKDDAHRLGARWDRENKVWYAPAGVDLTPLERWRPDNTPLHVQVARDPREEFAAALREAGFVLDGQPDMDGQLRRVRVEGDKPGDRSGAYVGHLDGHPAGYLKNHRTGLERTWKATGRASLLSARDRARLTAEAGQRRQARAEEREQQYEQAAEKAEARWAAAVPVDEHPYLTVKDVPSYGLRQEADGNLVVPVRDLDGKLWSLQTIDATGRKSFQKDARAHGGHFVIGDPARAGTLLIAEGYATAATVHQATGLPVAVAFHAGNLVAVADAYRAHYPDKVIVIAGDNDHRKAQQGQPNVGRDKAHEAAARVGGIALLPAFNADDPGSDWNDLAKAQGPDAARRQLHLGLARADRQHQVNAQAKARDRSPATVHSLDERRHESRAPTPTVTPPGRSRRLSR